MSNTPSVPAADFAYRLTRAGVIMSPEPGNPNEAEGVVNPASGRGPDGELYLLPPWWRPATSRGWVWRG